MASPAHAEHILCLGAQALQENRLRTQAMALALAARPAAPGGCPGADGDSLRELRVPRPRRARVRVGV